MTTHNSDQLQGDAQATIVELRAQVEAVREELAASKEIVRRIAQGQEPIRCLTEGMSMVLELRQRVAQLEAMLAEEHPGLEEMCNRLTALQADHAHAVGLVQEFVRHFESDFENPGLELYGRVGGREICAGGQALNALLAKAKATLPAQPTKGTSLSIAGTIEHDDA